VTDADKRWSREQTIPPCPTHWKILNAAGAWGGVHQKTGVRSWLV
jgi:hypothetical protein